MFTVAPALRSTAFRKLGNNIITANGSINGKAAKATVTIFVFHQLILIPTIGAYQEITVGRKLAKIGMQVWKND